MFIGIVACITNRYSTQLMYDHSGFEKLQAKLTHSLNYLIAKSHLIKEALISVLLDFIREYQIMSTG